VAALPVAVRFLSCEPLLGPLDLRGIPGEDRVDWVIVGGESGPRAWPMRKAWVEDIQDQCREAGMPGTKWWKLEVEEPEAVRYPPLVVFLDRTPDYEGCRYVEVLLTPKIDFSCLALSAFTASAILVRSCA
jgi:hypothetical protein